MPPQIALLLCILFILYLFKIDSKRDSNVSRALWIPLIWLMIIGSRPVSLWLNPEPVTETAIDYLSGNPINRTVFIFLIAIGIFILSKRRMQISHILKNNSWITLLFLYCGISILWSDFPFVSFKRWIKEIGFLMMVLIILTEADPVEAVRTVIRRCAYVLIPLSIILIKYYLELSRSYNPWTGEVEFIGVATSKNMFATLCLVCGLFFVWHFLSIWRKKNISFDKKEVFINILFLLMISWLFIKANSVTSLVAFTTGICILIGLTFIKNNVRHIGLFIFVIFSTFLIMQSLFDIIGITVSGLGREMTFTGRTNLWKDVINMDTNPLIGTGYESFWLGDRMKKLWETHWWQPNQAHNGYIETYLNLGLVGLGLLTGVIVSAYRKIKKTLLSNFDYGRLRMAFLITALLYNVTEAGFKATSLMWFIFLLIVIEVPHILQLPVSDNERRI